MKNIEKYRFAIFEPTVSGIVGPRPITPFFPSEHPKIVELISRGSNYGVIPSGKNNRIVVLYNVDLIEGLFGFGSRVDSL